MANTTYDFIYNVEGLSSRMLVRPKEWWDGAEKVAAEFDKSFFEKIKVSKESQLDERWHAGIIEQHEAGDYVSEPEKILLSPRFKVNEIVYRIRIHPAFITRKWMTLVTESYSKKTVSLNNAIKYFNGQKSEKKKINEIAEEEYINIVASLFNEKGLSKAEEWDRYNYSVAALGKKQEEMKEESMHEFDADLEILHDKRTNGGKIKDKWYGDDFESNLRKYKDLETGMYLGTGIQIRHHNMSEKFLTYDAIFSCKSGPDFERMARCLMQHSTIYPTDTSFLQL